MKIGKYKWFIVFGIIGVSIYPLMILFSVASLGFRSWEVARVTNSVTDEELINRTKELPEVKAFIGNYSTYDVFVDKDYHLAVIFHATSCPKLILTPHEHCDYAHLPPPAFKIFFDLSTGYPRETDYPSYSGL